jgi:hypothetical protein
MAAPPQLPPLPSGGGKGGKKKKPQTPAQRAASAAAYQQAKNQNPYFQGQDYLNKKQELDTIWEAYTGKRISDQQARRIIGLGWSNYHLQIYLSGQHSFVGSPVWKTNAPGYIGVYKQIYGSGKPKQKAIAYAIIHNLGSSFADYLRQQPGYIKSVEFKNNTASMENVYRSIYGAPDEHASLAIKQATLAGWNSDQFAKYLRGQPQYAYSDEARNVLDKFASAFGGTPSMTAEQALHVPGPYEGLPHDPRLAPPPGQPQQQQGQVSQYGNRP